MAAKKRMTLAEFKVRRNEELKRETGHLAKVRRSYKRKYSGERLELALKSLDLYKARCEANRDVSVANFRVGSLKLANKPANRKFNGALALARSQRDFIHREYQRVDCQKAILDGDHTHMVMSMSTLGFRRTSCPYGLPIIEKAAVKA